MCAPPVIPDHENGGWVVPTKDPEGWERPEGSPPDKVILYLAWPSANWLLTKYLDERGIKYVEVNGLSSVPTREKALDQFRASTDTHVLLLSNVGACGLNLEFANILIVVDNLWSAQEYEQLIGRVWRHGQKKEVIVYFVLALGTSDIFFRNVSLDKGLMHKVLTSMPTQLRKPAPRYSPAC